MMIRYSAKYLLLLLLAFGSRQLAAQQHHLLDEDQLSLAKEKATFCKPGVVNQSRGRGALIQYGNVGGHRLLPQSASSDGVSSGSQVSYVDQVIAKVKIPIINAPSLKVLAGYEYFAETYHFSEIGATYPELFQSLDNNPLRNNKYSLYFTKAFGDKYYAGLRLRTSYRGDYNQGMSFDGRYANYSALAIFGVKPRPDLEWGVGLTYSDNFFNRQVLPFAVYNRTFNDKWGIETVLPVSIMGRYNFRQGRLILFGAEYQSDSYAVDVLTGKSDQASPYFFRHAEIAVKASYDHHLRSWFWFNAEAGYQIPFRNEFINAQSGQAIDNSAQGQPFFKIGLFVTPPKECIK